MLVGGVVVVCDDDLFVSLKLYITSKVVYVIVVGEPRDRMSKQHALVNNFTPAECLDRRPTVRATFTWIFGSLIRTYRPLDLD